MNQKQYDIFGDIHGHASKLENILKKLGYEFQSGHYCHPTPNRQAIFVGDFIDRGPEIRRTLEIVKGMVDAGTALAVMGNHEFNAIAYHTRTPDGNNWLRSHNEVHIDQHKETIAELGDGLRIKPWIDWFRTLPFSLDLGELRVVHACWDEWAIDFMNSARKRHGGITDNFVIEATRKDNPEEKNLNLAHEWVLKGKELKLPSGCSFLDKRNHPRTNVRTCWFKNPEGNTYRDYIFPTPFTMDCLDEIVSADILDEAEMNRETGTFYDNESCPVFFGHYWLEPNGAPEFQAANVVCLDYSVAKNGHLCAYQWKTGEPLDKKNFVFV